MTLLKRNIQKTYNAVFKADKLVDPVCGLKQCYGDRPLVCYGGKNGIYD